MCVDGYDGHVLWRTNLGGRGEAGLTVLSEPEVPAILCGAHCVTGISVHLGAVYPVLPYVTSLSDFVQVHVDGNTHWHGVAGLCTACSQRQSLPGLQDPRRGLRRRASVPFGL